MNLASDEVIHTSTKLLQQVTEAATTAQNEALESILSTALDCR